MSLALQVQFLYLFFYIAIKRLVASFTVVQFYVAQISGCSFIRGYTNVAFSYDAFLRCPNFSLPFLPFPNFPVALFSVAFFSVAVFP